MPINGRIVVDEKYCKGCELCQAVCPKHLIALDMDNTNSMGYHQAHTTGEGCTGCALCALVCPDAAITVYRDTKVANTSDSKEK